MQHSGTPPPSTSALHSLRSICLSVLLSQQSHPIGFPSLQAPPKPLLSPLCDLSPEEQTLLQLWDELRDLGFERMKREAKVELDKKGGVLVTEGEGLDVGEDDESQEVEELDKRIGDLEEVVARLKGEEMYKEEIARAAMTGRELVSTVYGLRGDSGVSSVVKTLALRSLHHQHTQLTTTATHLHTHLTALQQTLNTLSAQQSTQTTTNCLLTTRLLNLTSQLSARSLKSNIKDTQLREKVEEMESQLRDVKLRWEVSRNVFQGVVAGSGVDWVRVEDGRVRALILEAGTELE